jgi:hypothetical protein
VAVTSVQPISEKRTTRQLSCSRVGAVLGVEYAVGAAAITEDNAQVAAKILDLDRVSEAPSDVDRSWLNDRSITSKKYLIKFITYCF